MEKKEPTGEPTSVKRARVLFVDDDVNLLAGVKRLLRREFEIVPAVEPESALSLLRLSGQFAVVVSDLRMPQMDGVTLLSKIRMEFPDVIRILLTGQGDLESAIKATNEGSIFRFLTKPCPTEQLEAAIRAAIRQYELITAERVLLQETLNGAVRVLTDVLSLVNPLAFGRANRIKAYVQRLASALQLTEIWKYEVAAMLSQIGCVALPAELLEKLYAGLPLSESEVSIVRSHPQLGRDLIRNIPRLEEVGEMIFYQNKNYDGSGWPVDARSGEAIPLGALLIKVAADFDQLGSTGYSRGHALHELRSRKGKYSPRVLKALEHISPLEQKELIKSISLTELCRGMTIAQDVTTVSGILLVSRGQEVTDAMIQRLLNYRGGGGVNEPLIVKTSELEQEVKK